MCPAYQPFVSNPNQQGYYGSNQTLYPPQINQQYYSRSYQSLYPHLNVPLNTNSNSLQVPQLGPQRSLSHPNLSTIKDKITHSSALKNIVKVGAKQLFKFLTKSSSSNRGAGSNYNDYSDNIYGETSTDGNESFQNNETYENNNDFSSNDAAVNASSGFSDCVDTNTGDSGCGDSSSTAD